MPIIGLRSGCEGEKWEEEGVLVTSARPRRPLTEFCKSLHQERGEAWVRLLIEDLNRL
jgi:hypothetical protein